jgi:hypothetical protein
VKPLCFGVLVAGKRGHKGAKTPRIHKELCKKKLTVNEIIKFKQSLNIVHMKICFIQTTDYKNI